VEATQCLSGKEAYMPNRFASMPDIKEVRTLLCGSAGVCRLFPVDSNENV
jgi:hypothetical protein